ncbi:MAG: DUF167 domain-containing protein [Steroidobacteraceae bacterium]
MTPPVRLDVKVVPGASRSGLAGWLGGALKLRVTAPPERGRANCAVCALLAEALALPADCVRIVGGHGSTRKVVEVERLSAAEIGARLGRPRDPAGA